MMTMKGREAGQHQSNNKIKVDEVPSLSLLYTCFCNHRDVIFYPGSQHPRALLNLTQIYPKRLLTSAPRYYTTQTQ